MRRPRPDRSRRSTATGIGRAAFEAEGCGAASAAGSAVVELVDGQAVPRRSARRRARDRRRRSAGSARASSTRPRWPRTRSTARSGRRPRRPRPHRRDRRTLVAMSGGVDSAVAAHLAAERGDEVVAVTLELWADPAVDTTRSCCSSQAVATARALAHGMGIPHLTLDLREPFGDRVVADFVAEHRAGRTPNPCVRCNGMLRFDAMLDLADRLGAARLATGHYARVEHDRRRRRARARARQRTRTRPTCSRRCRPARLDRVWFPLGDLTKPEVRQLARDGSPAGGRQAREPGPLLPRRGRRPRGVPAPPRTRPRRGRSRRRDRRRATATSSAATRASVTSRSASGAASASPARSRSTSSTRTRASGRVRVGPRRALRASRVTVRGAALHRPAAAVDRVKLRYRSEPLAGCVAEHLAPGRHPRLTLELDEPAEGVAPGQTACLMQGDRVVGWGVIGAGRSAHAG